MNTEHTNTIIRKVAPADMDQLVRLCADHAAYEKASFEILDQGVRLAEALFGKAPKLNCIVIDKDGVLIGYTTFMKQYATWSADHYVHMDCMFLSVQARNQGLGQKLMDEVENFAKIENCHEIQWQTPDWNEGAIRFYQRNGAVSKNKKRFFKKVWLPESVTQ